MKKIIFVFIIMNSMLFATSQFKTNQFPDCSEMKLNESKSIISCLNGDYEVTFEVNNDGTRNMQLEPTIKLIAEANQIIQYIQE